MTVLITSSRNAGREGREGSVGTEVAHIGDFLSAGVERSGGGEGNDSRVSAPDTEKSQTVGQLVISQASIVLNAANVTVNLTHIQPHSLP